MNGGSVAVKTRRKFITFVMRCLTAGTLILSPLYSALRLALAETVKRILPKGFDLQRLINQHPREFDTRQLEPMPLEAFKTMGLSDHEIYKSKWRLEVRGRVKRNLDLTYDQVLKMQTLQRNVLLICPGVFSNFGRWEGVSIRTLLASAEADPGVTHVTLRGPKGTYEKVERFPIADVNADKIFLAYRVNGKTLPVKHGYPLRLIAEGEYGFRWVKYIYRVEADVL
jgi:sulfoxide reductase catalytic subunit YedY